MNKFKDRAVKGSSLNSEIKQNEREPSSEKVRLLETFLIVTIY